MAHELVTGLGCFCAIGAAGGLAYYVYQSMSSQNMATHEEGTEQVQLSLETVHETEDISAFNSNSNTQECPSLSVEVIEEKTTLPNTNIQHDNISQKREFKEKLTTGAQPKTSIKRYFLPGKKNVRQHTVIDIQPTRILDLEISNSQEDVTDVENNDVATARFELNNISVYEDFNRHINRHQTTNLVQHSFPLKEESIKNSATKTIVIQSAEDASSSKKPIEAPYKTIERREIMVQVVNGHDVGCRRGSRILSPSPTPWPYNLNKLDLEDITSKTFYYEGKRDHRLVAISEGTSTDTPEDNENPTYI